MSEKSKQTNNQPDLKAEPEELEIRRAEPPKRKIEIEQQRGAENLGERTKLMENIEVEEALRVAADAVWEEYQTLAFKIDLNGDPEKLRRRYDGRWAKMNFDIDHALLALGDERLGNKKISELPLVTKIGDRIIFHSYWHPAAQAYSMLLRLDPLKQIDVGGGQTMSVEELAYSTLERIDLDHAEDKKGKTYDIETEWVTLIALDALKKGKKIEMKDYEGKPVKIEDLIKLNEKEFVNSGTCRGLHALHALMAYAVYKGDKGKIKEYTDYIFNELRKKSLEKPSECLHDLSEQYIGHIAHLLTALNELPVDFQFDKSQQNLLRRSVKRLAEEMHAYVIIANEKYVEIDTGSLAHGIDAIKRMPKSWWQ